MRNRSKFLNFAVISALVVGGFILPITPANAALQVAPNGTQVALGQSHVVALDSTGKVWTWGRIYPGNGGTGTWDTLTRPTEVTMANGTSFSAVSISAGEQSSVVVTSEGDVYAWGYNGNGLGNGSGYQAPRSTPVKVAFPSGVRIVEVSGKCNGYLARSDQGAVYQWGSFYGMWSLSSTTPVVALSAGSVSGDEGKQLLARGCSSAFAVKADGSFFAWGANGGGKLGNGSTADSASPVSVTIPSQEVTQISASSTHTLARTSSGFVYAWGGNSNGQLARNPSTTSFLNSPTRVGTIANALTVSSSDSAPYSSYVSSTGVVSNWGSYFGNGSDANASVPTPLTAPADLSTQIISGTGYQNGQAFVGQDGSIWTRGLYSNDGNCGADANSYAMWINGRMQSPRTFVRVFSEGQFGSNYVEDQISINSLKTSTGATLGLDGSGVVTAFVGDQVSLEASRPTSQCFSASELEYKWDLDGDGIFSDDANITSDAFGNPTITGSTTLTQAHGRQKGGLRISNSDGYSKTYQFDVRVVVPAQINGPVDAALPYVATYQENGLVGAAVGTNGKLYAWGSADVSPEGNTRLPSLVSTSDPSLRFVRVELGRADGCGFGNCGMSSSIYAVAMTGTGDLYVWGTGATVHPGTPGQNAGADATHVAVPVKVTSPTPNDPVVDYIAGSNRVVALTSSGQVWQWGRSTSTCSMTCTYSMVGPEIIPSLAGTDQLSPSNQAGYSFLYSSGGDWAIQQVQQLGMGNFMSSGSTPIPSMQGADRVLYADYQTYVGLINGVWTLEDGSPMELPAGEITEVHGSQSRLSVILSDGSLWNYDQVDGTTFSWQRQDPPGSAARFAGESAGGWLPTYISTTGQVINAGGTCVEGDDEGSGSVMFSDGNLGPAHFEDGQNIYLTSNNGLKMNQWEWTSAHTYKENAWDQGNGTVAALHLNPSSSHSIEVSVGSDCVSRAALDVKVDTDDDGAFETDLTLGSIPSTSSVDTQQGFSSNASRGQDALTMDLSNAGGKYVGVQVTSRDVFLGQDYVSTVRLPIVVEPVRPSGKYSGVSINRGAEFTESADVKLGLVWPAGAVTADISNDGGFEVSRNVPLDASVNWRLSDLTSGKVGSSVYVKFLGLNATVDGSWQETDIQPGPAYTDNITMDLTPPVVSTVDASVSASQSSALGTLRNLTSKIRSFVSIQTSSEQVARIAVDASDAGSGVTAMQVTSDPAVPGAELPYQTSISMPVEKDTVAVRVKDSVGNWSSWKYVKISGFVATTPTPPNPTPNQPSSPVTERPVASQPVLVPAPAVVPAPAAAPEPLKVAPKAKAAGSAVAASLGVVVPANAKVSLTVSKSSKAVCKVSGGKLVALKPGNCVVTVSVQAAKPKGGKKPKPVKTSGIVTIG